MSSIDNPLEIKNEKLGDAVTLGKVFEIILRKKLEKSSLVPLVKIGT